MIYSDILTKKLCKLYLNNRTEDFKNIRFNSGDSSLIKNLMRKNEIFNYNEKILRIKTKPVAIISIDKNNKYSVVIQELIRPFSRSLRLLMLFRNKNYKISESLELIDIN